MDPLTDLAELIDNGILVRRGLAKGCRCGSCTEYVAFTDSYDPDDKGYEEFRSSKNGDAIDDFIGEAREHFAAQPGYWPWPRF